VVIGCDSASQAVSIGDEYLGLVSGLLCGGAASVIGASWPIPSASGRASSDALYANMKSSPGVGGNGWTNLAEALQEAVLSIMDSPNTSAPYYWAGFCLYGSWVLLRK
jgi:CHAT domain-containing protein